MSVAGDREVRASRVQQRKGIADVAAVHGKLSGIALMLLELDDGTDSEAEAVAPALLESRVAGRIAGSVSVAESTGVIGQLPEARRRLAIPRSMTPTEPGSRINAPAPVRPGNTLEPRRATMPRTELALQHKVNEA
jgi:hypothetical protein